MEQKIELQEVDELWEEEFCELTNRCRIAVINKKRGELQFLLGNFLQIHKLFFYQKKAPQLRILAQDLDCLGREYHSREPKVWRSIHTILFEFLDSVGREEKQFLQ